MTTRHPLGLVLLLLLVSSSWLVYFVQSQDCPPAITREYLVGKNFTTISHQGFNLATAPSDFNQMHLYFRDQYVHAHIVDFNYEGNIRDLVMEFIVEFTVYDGKINFGGDELVICYEKFGIFSSRDQYNVNRACSKWNRFFTSATLNPQNIFTTQLSQNCSELNLKNSALDLVFKESITYPSMFCDEFVNRENEWYVTQDDQHKFYVQFSQVRTVPGYKLGHFQLMIENSVGSCNGSQSLVVGQFEIFSNYSIINSNVTSCLNSNDKCNVCNDHKLKQILFGQLHRNSECTQFSVLNASNFTINGQSPQPFNPYNPKKDNNTAETIGIIVGASIGGLLVILCFSISVIGLVYLARRKKQYTSLN